MGSVALASRGLGGRRRIGITTSSGSNFEMNGLCTFLLVAVTAAGATASGKEVVVDASENAAGRIEVRVQRVQRRLDPLFITSSSPFTDSWRFYRRTTTCLLGTRVIAGGGSIGFRHNRPRKRCSPVSLVFFSFSCFSFIHAICC